MLWIYKWMGFGSGIGMKIFVYTDSRSIFGANNTISERKKKMAKKAGKPCLIADTAISGPLATRVRLLRHLSSRREIFKETRAQATTLCLCSLWEEAAAPPTALMSSPQKASREKSHRL